MLNHEVDYIYSTMCLREGLKGHWTERDDRLNSASVSLSLNPKPGSIDYLSHSLFFSKVNTKVSLKSL